MARYGLQDGFLRTDVLDRLTCMGTPVLAREAIDPRIACLAPGTSIQAALTTLLDRRATHAVVILEGQFLGAVRTDVLAAAEGRGPVSRWLPRAPAPSFAIDAPLEQCLPLLVSEQYDAIALLDEHGGYSGLVTAQSALACLAHARRDTSIGHQDHARLLKAQEIGRLGFWEWNLSTDDLFWSPQQYRLFGYEPDEVKPVMATFLEHVHPHDRDLLLEHVRKCIEQKTPFHMRHRIVTRQGETRVVDCEAIVCLDDQGVVLRMEGTDHDVTESSQVEEELRVSEQRLSLLMDSIPAYVSYVDNHERYQWVNERYEQFHQRPRNAIIGATVAQLVGDQAYQSMKEHIRQALQGHPVRYENVLLDPQGIRHFFDVHYIPHITFDARTAGFFVLVFDVTSERIAHRQLATSEKRLRLALEAGKQGTYDIDLRTGTVTVSDEYAKLLGHKAQGFTQSIDGLIQNLHPEDHQGVTTLLDDCINGRRHDLRVECRHRTIDEGWKWFYSLGEVAEWNEQGKPARIIGTCTDISDLKQTQFKLRQSERELEHVAKLSMANSMAAAVAHELNQPLQVISNYTFIVHNALKTDSLDKQTSIDYLQKACGQALRAGKIIANLRSLFERREFNPTPTSLPLLIDDSLRVLSAEIMSTRINVIRNYAPSVPQVMVDPVLFQQVILNVLSNAIESMRHTSDKARELTIDVHGMDRSLNIVIRDSGVGMSPQIISRIEEPFFTTKRDGLGLGLAVSRRIAEKHGANLSITSKPNVGTTVSMRLDIPQGISP